MLQMIEGLAIQYLFKQLKDRKLINKILLCRIPINPRRPYLRQETLYEGRGQGWKK